MCQEDYCTKTTITQRDQLISGKIYLRVRPTAAVILVFITGHPIITEWGDYSIFDIPTFAQYLLEQLWERQMYCNHPIL